MSLVHGSREVGPRSLGPMCFSRASCPWKCVAETIAIIDRPGSLGHMREDWGWYPQGPVSSAVLPQPGSISQGQVTRAGLHQLKHCSGQQELSMDGVHSMELTFLHDFVIWKLVKLCEGPEILGRGAGPGTGQDNECFLFVVPTDKMILIFLIKQHLILKSTFSREKFLESLRSFHACLNLIKREMTLGVLL